MASGNSNQTEKTLTHHREAFEAGDVEAIMSDYATDAVLMTPDGPLKGHAEIGSQFEKIG